MNFLIEGETYDTTLLSTLFKDAQFYNQDGQKATINTVGYYHSYETNTVIYMLPKVFMRDGNNTIFGISKDDLLDIISTDSFKHKSEYLWVRQISIYFYNSLLEYKRRKNNTKLVAEQPVFELNTSLGDQEYSYLDLILSFVNFYKRHRNNVLFKHIETRSNQIKKPNWDRTIRKSIPLINSSNQPVYTIFRNKKKIVDREEELFIYFFSILNRFNEEHNLYLKIDTSYEIISGSKFELLQRNGLSRLRKIKHRYFNDTLKKMYRLCEMYFSLHDLSSLKKRKDEFICVSNYNLVFEDMVDKLFSDPIEDKKTEDGISLKSLKYNDDGKIVDHVFDYTSLIDTSNIFYIGDSKYYKSNNKANKISKYKQFTYAKNVIQYNIDLLNEKKEYSKGIRYRDKITEGYNITPNFFIYGYIENYNDFDNECLEEKGNIVRSRHFENRLFDRDSLFVHQYKINFLYVLKSYTGFSSLQSKKFRGRTHNIFRENFVLFFNDVSKSGFSLFEYLNPNVDQFVNENFRILLGKCYKTKDDRLIIALAENDSSLDHKLSDFKELILT